MIPAAPLVGAVTTRPPLAFSSLTARAYRLTQSSTDSGSRKDDSGLLHNCRCSAAARRLTFKPPGRMPSLRQPAATQSCMTCQIFSRPARVSASGRQALSFVNITWLIDRPYLAQ
ncbi:hypothetical protein D3C85_1433910 [compost metagenome]